jgi:Mg2+-importing ATPase
MVLLLLATVSLFTDYVFVPADQKDLSTVIIMITMIIISGLTSLYPECEKLMTQLKTS